MKCARCGKRIGEFDAARIGDRPYCADCAFHWCDTDQIDPDTIIECTPGMIVDVYLLGLRDSGRDV